MGQTFESLAPGRVPQVNPNTYCLVGQTVESEARGRAPQRNPNSRCLAAQTIQSETPGRVPQVNPNPHCLVGQAIESEARGGVPQDNPLLRPGQPGSIIRPCSSLFTDPYTPNTHTSQQIQTPLIHHRHSNRCSATCSAPRKITTNNGIARPRDPIFLGAFNVRTLCQMGQQASLAQTLLSLKLDVCCVSETRIQDPTSVIQLRPPGTNPAISCFTLRVSGDFAAAI